MLLWLVTSPFAFSAAAWVTEDGADADDGCDDEDVVTQQPDLQHAMSEDTSSSNPSCPGGMSSHWCKNLGATLGKITDTPETHRTLSTKAKAP